MKSPHRIAAAAVVGYLLSVGLISSFERRRLFPAPVVSLEVLHTEARAQGAEEIALRAEDGTQLYGWHLRGSDAGIVLWFDGNGGSVGMRPGAFRRLRDAGWDVVQINYRGYPGSEGVPSEAGLRMDARAAWAYASGFGHPWIYGKSLGGGVAVGLAAEVDARGLLLESTFESAVRVGMESMPWLPVRQMMTSPFDSAALAPRVRCPVLILHGEDDEMIGVRHAYDLARAFPTPPDVVTFPGLGHNDELLTTERGWAAMVEWIGPTR